MPLPVVVAVVVAVAVERRGESVFFSVCTNRFERGDSNGDDDVVVGFAVCAIGGETDRARLEGGSDDGSFLTLLLFVRTTSWMGRLRERTDASACGNEGGGGGGCGALEAYEFKKSSILCRLRRGGGGGV